MTRYQSKLIGLIGGMSWESTALYYRLLNLAMHRELGGHNNARSVLLTLNYHELDSLASSDRWDELGETIGAAAQRLEHCGSDFLMMTAVTAHAVADRVEAALGVPLLHIADPVGRAVRRDGARRVGLLGTRFTMTMDFFKKRLGDHHGLDVVVPSEAQQREVHTIILDELSLGRVEASSQAKVLSVATALMEQGADAIIVGCTELPLLLDMDQYPIPAYDVPGLHVEAAVQLALGSDESPP